MLSQIKRNTNAKAKDKETRLKIESNLIKMRVLETFESAFKNYNVSVCLNVLLFVVFFRAC